MKKLFLVLLPVIIVTIMVISYVSLEQNVNEDKSLTPILEIDLLVPEPSGLYYDNTTNTLWTVSDENSTVYNISLQGNVLDSFIVKGFDLEGITLINDSTIFTILERDRTVIKSTLEGTEISRFKINISGEPNKGLEGIAFNSNKNLLYLLNEKDPGVLLNVNHKGEILSEINLKLAADYSGLCFDEYHDQLWIISDEDQTIFKCNSDGLLIDKYKVAIEQIEGIAINFEDSLLYIISDPLEKLFVFELP